MSTPDLQSLSDQELVDEITVAREYITSASDLKLRRKMQAKLADLLGEQGRRQTVEDIPW